ncbi:probable calcium-binding protein CML36 [Magnolia sinica]|uniref:probable calcium-binding protein CML36 n=1 Tax=Magnolia sinica TaxID=86752 RepID=UPI00265ACEF1|nr:probable calcium-binding protein CML36 [Magnolia sinica]
MKLIPSFPSKSKKQNKLKKSESNPLSFSSSISSHYSSGTPKSVLPPSPPYNSISSSNSESSSSKPNSTDFDILEVFKIFDRDNDGKITLTELELLFHRLGFEPPTQEELSLMLAEADLDGDGCISLEEFGALSSTLGPAHGSELRDAFDYFDNDKDGRISAEELHGVFLTLGDDGCTLEDCRRMIGGVDAEGKGFVGFEDFVRMMEAQR